MKIEIIVVYVPRYTHGHEMDFVPPITGVHLAALTPTCHSVRVIHQQVDAIPYESDADLIALSFFTGFAPEAYRLALHFKQRGKIVVAGGPHVTFWSEEALRFFDSVVLGEAESVWPALLNDAQSGALKKTYIGQPLALDNLPMPRYNLLSKKFFVRRVVQATRGCPFLCSFCSVPSLNPGFRTRPLQDVLREIQFDNFPHWWQRKIVWFWDDNLTANRRYVKELLRAMIPLKRWWLTQASMDIARDDELLDLMQRSGCIGVFLGIESFGEQSLKSANKAHNKIGDYKQSIEKLHARGIAVMAGMIAGFDGDTPHSIVAMADHLDEIGVDVPFLSILTPFKGAAAYNDFERQGRLIEGRGWQFYNGYNVAFQPRGMSADQLLQAHRQLWVKAFSPSYVARRLLRSGWRLRLGALLLSLAMNAFYGFKAWRGNLPVDMALRDDTIAACECSLSSTVVRPLP